MRASRRTVLEQRVLVGAVAVGLLHAADGAVINRSRVFPHGQHLAALAMVTAITVATAVLYSV